jgi:DNA-directed RNA polymerase beta' subunit
VRLLYIVLVFKHSGYHFRSSYSFTSFSCTGFNADFDGDQMAVHLPLYEASQLEAQ